MDPHSSRGSPPGGPRTSPAPAARRRQPRLPPLDTGAFQRGSAVDHTTALFRRMCELSEAAVEDAASEAAAAAMAAAHFAPDGRSRPSPRPAGRRRQQRRRKEWQPHDCSADQLAELANISVDVKELCAEHEACADALVPAAAELGGRRLQQLLAVLDQAGEALLADFLRRAVYSDRIAEELKAGLAFAADSSRGQGGGAAQAGQGQRSTSPSRQGGSSGPHAAAQGLAVGHSLRASSRAAQRGASGEEQHAAWREAAYLDAYASPELGGEAGAEPIFIPQVFRTRIIRRRQPGNGWLPGLLAGAAVAALSDEAMQATAFVTAAASPERLADRQLGKGRALCQPAAAAAWPAPPGRRLSAQHQALLRAVRGQRFQQEIAAARASQQHHSEEEACEGQTEAERYADLLAELPPLPLLAVAEAEESQAAEDAGPAGAEDTSGSSAADREGRPAARRSVVLPRAAVGPAERSPAPPDLAPSAGLHACPPASSDCLQSPLLLFTGVYARC